MLHGPSHGALHVLASVNNGASITDGNSVTPTQVFRSSRTSAKLASEGLQSHNDVLNAWA